MQINKPRVFEFLDGVPSHLRYLELGRGWAETDDGHVEDAEAIDVSFFAMTAEELHADADAEDGLTEITNDVRQARLIEILHGSTRFAYARKDDAVGLADGLGVIGNLSLAPEALAGTIDTVDVARIVFDDSYFHISHYTIESCCCATR